MILEFTAGYGSEVNKLLYYCGIITYNLPMFCGGGYG
jgi:hypothetical protein